MKTATIIFVALTVFSGLFLESSSAPSLVEAIVDVGIGRANILDSVKELVHSKLQNKLAVADKLQDKTRTKTEIKETLKRPLEELIQVFKKLSDAIKNRDVGLIQEILKLVDVVLVKINTLFAQLLEKYEDDATIKDFLDEIAKLVNGIVTKLVKLVKPFLKELVDEIANGPVLELNKLVAGLLKALDEPLAGTSGDVIELITKIKEVLKKLKENIVKLIKAILEAITTGTLVKIEPLFADCKSNIDVLKQLCVHADLPDVKNITKIIELVDVIFLNLNVINEIFNYLPVTELGKICKEVIALVYGLLEGLPAGTTELYEPLKIFSELVCKCFIALENDNIVDVQNLEVLICKVIKTVKAIADKLLETLGDKAKEKIEKALQVIEKVVKKLLKELKPIINILIDGVKDILSKLIADLAGIFKKIKEALADAKGEIKELLIIMRGLLKELLEKLLDLIKAVVGLVANVSDKSLNKVNGLGKEIEELLHEISRLSESESGEGIGKELKGSIRVVVDIAKRVLVLVEFIVKARIG